jgi:hypothetical protein
VKHPSSDSLGIQLDTLRNEAQATESRVKELESDLSAERSKNRRRNLGLTDELTRAVQLKEHALHSLRRLEATLVDASREQLAALDVRIH